MKKSVVFLLLLLALCLFTSLSISAEGVFSDVTENDWFYSYVNEAYGFGFINGRSSTMFCPYENLTIAEALKLADMLFINIMKLDISLENGQIWYEPYVEFARNYNILDIEFSDYNAPISRRDFVHVFYNAIPPQNIFEYIEYLDGAVPDVLNNEKYYNEIYTFYRAGILTGKNETHTFYPNDKILRSEVCAVLMRIFYMNSFKIELDESESEPVFNPSSPPPSEYITFNLIKNYSDVVLKETSRETDAYLDGTAFVGDSLSVGLRAFRILPDKSVLAAGSIDPSHAIKDKLIMLPTTEKVTIPEACGYYLPERVVITLGTNSVSWRKPDDFINLYSELIDKILYYSPNTRIIIQSIPPVSEKYEEKGTKINNKVINSFNEYLADLCRERGLYFLNTAEILKNERGYLDESYQSGDGLHLNQKAYKLWVDYFMTHSVNLQNK
ncbi:MAG: S-layer homology domain-containing protein [Clostridia bacterium]|nr:S-layer homology domain-containing protein [Clostridia bacterium]